MRYNIVAYRQLVPVNQKQYSIETNKFLASKLCSYEISCCLIRRMYGPIFFVTILGAFHEIAAASQHINKDLTNHYNARFHVYEEPYSIDFTYHNYEQMSRFLRTTSLRFQNLTALYSIGKSVKGMLLEKLSILLLTISTILVLKYLSRYIHVL